MARQYRLVIAASLIAAAPLLADARAPQPGPQQERPPQQNQSNEKRGDHDRRPWWKNPRDMAEIGLTADQSATIDSIFKTEIEKMKPLRETLNRLERSLNETIRANTTEVSVFTREVERIEKLRSELNTMRTVLLYRMRRVLNAEQNAKFHAMWDRREAERRRQDNDRRR
jgi:Spy/CpxP family protein refolding chaperone